MIGATFARAPALEQTSGQTAQNPLNPTFERGRRFRRALLDLRQGGLGPIDRCLPRQVDQRFRVDSRFQSVEGFFVRTPADLLQEKVPAGATRIRHRDDLEGQSHGRGVAAAIEQGEEAGGHLAVQLPNRALGAKTRQDFTGQLGFRSPQADQTGGLGIELFELGMADLEQPLGQNPEIAARPEANNRQRPLAGREIRSRSGGAGASRRPGRPAARAEAGGSRDRVGAESGQPELRPGLCHREATRGQASAARFRYWRLVHSSALRRVARARPQERQPRTSPPEREPMVHGLWTPSASSRMR